MGRCDWSRRSSLAVQCKLLLLLTLVGCAIPPGLPSHRASFGIGSRSLRDDAFGPLDSQFLARIEGEVRPESWPVSVSMGLGYGADSYEETTSRTCFLFFCSEQSVRFESQTVDLSLGARLWRALEDDSLRWFVGAGNAYVFSTLERPANRRKASDRSDSFGAFVELGVSVPTSFGDWTLQWRSFFGTDSKLFGVDTSSDFGEIGIYVSTTW